jgi:hypothetical protein
MTNNPFGKGVNISNPFSNPIAANTNPSQPINTNLPQPVNNNLPQTANIFDKSNMEKDTNIFNISQINNVTGNQSPQTGTNLFQINSNLGA